MCNVCGGSGTFATRPFPSMVDIESCSCVDYTASLDRLEQQLQILDKKIEDFEKGMSYEGETLDTGGSGIS